jgi:acyl carrier protein
MNRSVPNILVRDILRDVFPGYDRMITADTHFDIDIMADSLEMVMLAMRIENATGIAIDNAWLEDLQTVGDLETFLADRAVAS